MAKKMETNNYGVYKVEGETLKLKKGGFSNTYECEKWIRGQVRGNTDKDMGGEFAIVSLRKRFTLETKTTVSVKLVESDARPSTPKTDE